MIDIRCLCCVVCRVIDSVIIVVIVAAAADAPPLPPDLIFAKFISERTTRYNKIVSTEYIFNIGDDDNPNNVLLSDEDLLGPHNNLKVWKITDKPIPLWGKMNSFLYNAGNSKHRKSKKSKTIFIK